MSGYFQEARRKAREEYARETAGEATAAEREEANRRYVRAPFLAQFDRDFAAEFGRYPAESPLAGTTPVNERRREAIQALIDRGATQGEREAAQAALHRLEHPTHAESDRMQRGGNYASDDAHARTERGSYYARDTLAGTSGDE